MLFFLAAAAADDGYFALADPGVRAAKAPSFVPSASSSSPPPSTPRFAFPFGPHPAASHDAASASVGAAA